MALGPDRPAFKVKKIDWTRLPSEPGSTDEQYDLTIIWKNASASPAWVVRIGVGSTISGTPPPFPMYRFFEGPNIAAEVEGGGRYVFKGMKLTLVVTAEQRAKIELGVVVPWLWGEIRYQTSRGETMESGFVASKGRDVLRVGSQTLLSGGWRFNGPASYTYTRAKSG